MSTLEEITGILWDDTSQFGEFYRRLMLESHEIHFSEGIDQAYLVNVFVDDKEEAWQGPDLPTMWEGVLGKYPAVAEELQAKISEREALSKELEDVSGLDWKLNRYGYWEAEQGQILYSARKVGDHFHIATEIEFSNEATSPSLEDAWKDTVDRVGGVIGQIQMDLDFADSRKHLRRILSPDYKLDPETKAMFEALDREAELRKASSPPLSPEEVIERLASWIADAGSDYAYRTVKVSRED
jgi:hypothetical protein